MNQYLEIYDDNLTSYFCKHVIKKFEKDDRSRPGHVGRGYDVETKDSQDLFITDLDDWKKEDNVFFSKLNPLLEDYYDRHFTKWDPTLKDDHRWDTGYQIQRTTPSQLGYVWHYDSFVKNNSQRIITYLWYLNDIPEEDEGSTEFYDGTKIQPKEGRLILFPASWCWWHKGNPPKRNNKYICTGWVWVSA